MYTINTCTNDYCLLCNVNTTPCKGSIYPIPALLFALYEYLYSSRRSRNSSYDRKQRANHLPYIFWSCVRTVRACVLRHNGGGSLRTTSSDGESSVAPCSTWPQRQFCRGRFTSARSSDQNGTYTIDMCDYLYLDTERISTSSFLSVDICRYLLSLLVRIMPSQDFGKPPATKKKWQTVAGLLVSKSICCVWCFWIISRKYRYVLYFVRLVVVFDWKYRIEAFFIGRCWSLVCTSRLRY